MSVKRPYERYVKLQKQKNPSFANLCSFFESSQRNACRIACLDFTTKAAPPQEYRLDPSQLRDELSGIPAFGEHAGNGSAAVLHPDEKHLLKYSNATNADTVGRIFIIEDLTAEVVEVLGSTLGVDPLFFASHIHAPEKVLVSQTPELANLPSRYKQANFINIHYHRSVLFKDATRRWGKLLRCSNVARKLAVLPPTKGAQLGLLQHCCSVLKTLDSKNRWLGIILVDPPLSDYYTAIRSGNILSPALHLPSELFLGGYEDFLPPAPFGTDSPIDTGPPRSSPLEDLLHYWSQDSHPTSSCYPILPSLLTLSYYSLKIAAAEWTMYINVVNYSIKEYEYRAPKRPDFLAEVERLNTHLAELQAWRRRALSSQQKVDNVIRALTTFQQDQQTVNQRDRHNDNNDNDSNGNSTNDESPALTLLKEDYTHLSASLTQYSKMMENMLPVLTSFAQIVDARRSFTETANISRLTILALIFVPLSFLSSLFGMNDVYAPGGNLFWVFFATAVPVTVVVFFVARPPGRDLKRLGEWGRGLGRGLWRGRRRGRGRGEGEGEEGEEEEGTTGEGRFM